MREHDGARNWVPMRGAALIAVTILAVHAAVLLLVRDDRLRVLLDNVLDVDESVLSAACLYVASRRLATQDGAGRAARGWRLLAAGMALFALGNVVWGFEETILNITIFPSLADVFYLTCYVLVFAGLFQATAPVLQRRDTLKLMLDVAIIVLAGLLAYWTLVATPLQADPLTGERLHPLFTVLYPILDLGLLCVATLVLLRLPPLEERLAPSLLALSVVLLFLGDAILNYQLLSGAYIGGTLAGLPHSACWLCAGLAGVARARVPRTKRRDALEVDLVAGYRRDRLSMSVGYVLLTGGAVLLAVAYRAGVAGNAAGEMTSGLSVMIILVLLRQIMMWNDNTRLAKSLHAELAARTRQADISAAMAELGSALIVSTSTEAIGHKVWVQAKKLTDSRIGFVGYVDIEKEQMVVAHENGDMWGRTWSDAQDWTFSRLSGLLGWACDNRQPLLTNSPAHDPRSGGLPQGHHPIDRLLAVPALLDDTLVGLIAVANGSRDYDQDDLSVVQRLAALFALAVQQRRANESLVHAKAELIERVSDRTAELTQANESLRAAHAALSESEALYRVLVQTSPDGIALADRSGKILVCNDYFALLTGRRNAAELLGTSAFDVFVDQDASKAEDFSQHVLVGGAVHDVELAIPHKDGSTSYASLNTSVIFDAQGLPTGYIGVVRDITERKHAEDKLRYASNHDSLTELYNRAYFDDEFRQLEQSTRFPVTVLMMDVDQFKQINDMHGHAAGDVVLRRTAALLRRSFRGEDIVARVGGDEFAVLLPSTDKDAAASAVRRLKENVTLESMTGNVLPIGLSVGSATALKGNTLARALHRADARMYEQKLAHGVAKGALTSAAKGK